MSDRADFARPSYRPEQKAPGLDPDMKRMALVAAGFGGVLALVIGGLSMARHTGHVVPVISAPAGPVRIKPVDPGGMQVMGAEPVSSGEEKLAPPAEQPELRALHAKLKAARLASHAQLAVARPATAIAPPAPVQKAVALVGPGAASLAAVPPPKPATALAGTLVQLAAFDSQAAAEQDWGRMAEKMPDLFRPHRPDVVRADVAGRTIWRLRTGGFSTMANAVEFCAKVRAKGGDCSIAAF
jgi:hypothetical protein